MGISDVIACFISDALETQDGCAELQRSELAQKFGCVPSQINYVISTRFSPEHGYVVESRRGGGGYIRIRRAQLDPRRLIIHTINSIGDQIDNNTTRAFLTNLVDAGVVDQQCARLILSASGDSALKGVPANHRDCVRACILKQMLLNCL